MIVGPSDADGEQGGDEPELFGTETMAELCARQGRLQEAVTIYRKLIEARPQDDKLPQWTTRLAALERARSKVGGSLEVPPEPEPPPPPPPPAAAPPPVAGAAAPKTSEDTVRVSMPVPPEARPPRPAARSAPPPVPVHTLPLLIAQPVRSGQVVYARGNDLIVLGPVNPGGQVVADGNIHIYGPLRGRAVAGAQGAGDARIFCQRLEAELLAINGIYLVWDDIPPEALGKAAQIFVREGRCFISPL